MTEKRLRLVFPLTIIVLCSIGFVVASNVPESWSRQERLFLSSAMVVLFGLVVVYFASQFAKFPPRPIMKRKNANALMYVGFGLQYIGTGFQPGFNLGLLCIAIGSLFFLWGSIRFSKIKGYPTWLGALLGLTSILGFIILLLMPDRTGEIEKSA